MSQDDIATLVRSIAVSAKSASRKLASAESARKDAVLARVSSALRGGARDLVLEANDRDLRFAEDANLSAAMLERLRLDEKRVIAMADDVDAVRRLPDPVGQVDRFRTMPSGIRAGRMSVPLGVVAMIYESRPNVTSDASALCIKSGNACILRGGKEAFQSSRAIAAVYELALEAEGFPKAAVSFLPTTQREATLALLALDGLVDLAIPRGGEGLIRFVAENARVPVLKHYKGVCHVYVDGSADIAMAERILVNSKVQRPSVCNAAETLLVDAAIADRALVRLCNTMIRLRVELRGCERTRALVPSAKLATEADFDTEYNDFVLNVRVVDGLDGAIEHIARHGSQHTEAIITENYSHTQRFLREVDASAVVINASTRFNDGGQLGLGAEIGISTTKLHAYGPMGLEELCTKKWIIYGDGQVRT